jgi:CRP/FNR family transcriptional regulator
LVEDLAFKRVTSRLARILLKYSIEATVHNPSTFTQQEIAAMAGTVREVIGRSLKTLEQEGIIRLDRSRIIITDSQALRQVAG